MRDGKSYFHITRERDVAVILREGLRPRIGARAEQLRETAGVFLFDSQASAEDAVANWLGDEFEEDEQLVLLEVRLSPEMRERAVSMVDAEIEVRERIGPDLISVVVTKGEHEL